MEINFNFTELSNEVDLSLDTISPGTDFLYYTRSQTDALLANKVNTVQGATYAGKVLGINANGRVEPVDDFTIVTTVTKWNVMRPNQSETPALTLPVPETNKAQEIVYIFTAMTTNATFTAPTGYVLFDEDKTLATATSSIAYTNLTVGNLYECDFLVVGPNKISLLKIEHAGT